MGDGGGFDGSVECGKGGVGTVKALGGDGEGGESKEVGGER